MVTGVQTGAVRISMHPSYSSGRKPCGRRNLRNRSGQGIRERWNRKAVGRGKGVNLGGGGTLKKKKERREKGGIKEGQKKINIKNEIKNDKRINKKKKR